ncbi:MAG: helix-turn-helix transcriptional regulator [Pseudonocardiaceae bacterium]
MAKREGFARTRRAAGYTQESFAEALGVDRSTVVRWEAGDHEPLPYLQPKIARLLGVSQDGLIELLQFHASVHVGQVVPTVGSGEPGDHLASPGGLLLPVMIDGRPVFLPLDASALLEARGHRRSPTQDHGWSSADDTVRYVERLDDTLHTIVELSEEDVKRRDLLLEVACTTPIFTEPALHSLSTPPVANVARNAGGRRIGMTDVAILTDDVEHLRRMDFRYGAGRIREKVVRLLRHEAATLLCGSYSDSTGRALLTAVALAALRAGSMAADVGRHALAQRYYSQALDLAMHAGDRQFAAHILGSMSRLTIQNATGRRCARQAVALARAGKAVAGKPTPASAAELSAIEARAHALCQDTGAARTAVLQAEQHYQRVRPDGEPAWLSWYTEAELGADLGRALRDSGEPAHATRLLTRTLDNYEPWRVRSHCFVQTDLAAAYLIDGEHEHAAVLARDALTTASQVSSSRTISRIRALQQQIQPLRSAGLSELDEEITAFLRRAHDNEVITT